MNVEAVKQKLLSGDPDILQQELLSLYRRAEVFHSPQFGQILEVFFPIFKSLLLNKLPPQFRSTSTNRARKALLQIINRLPNNDILRPYVGQLLKLLMEVLERDNEENSLLALKTIFDLHRNYRPGLRNEVPVFLEFVHHSYRNIDTIVNKQFSGTPERASSLSTSSATSNSDHAISGIADSKEDHAKSADMPTTEADVNEGENVDVADINVEKKEEDIFTSNESFKIISETPLIIMLLFQCYPTYIDSYIPTLVPLMMTALSYRAPSNALKTYPSRYMHFLDCQVKTLSFVTYLLRGFASLMRPFQDAICENTVKLLIACPKDAFVIRKDIFVAARHIISTDFRRGFYSQLEILMDDDVLIGRGKTNSFQIRPLAYSTLADMIHHVRDMLSLVQVSKIVDFYGKRIHDPSLPLSIQTTSIRLLLNLVDICAKNEDPDGWKGRNILSRILLIIASKFKTTLGYLPIVLSADIKASCERANDFLDGSAMDKIKKSNLLPDVVAEPSVYEKQLRKLLDPHVKMQRGDDSVGDEEPQIRDVKSLLRTMILGVRAVIWCTANYRNPNARDLTALDISNHGSDGLNEQNLGSNENVGLHLYPLSDDERILIAKVLQNGLRCFVLYTLSENTVAEEKQMLDHFAGAFTVLDAEDFRDLFIANISLLYDCILQDHAMLTIPQHFLANANVSCWFAEILLKFLVSRMDDLSVESEGDIPDIDRAEKVMKMGCIKLEEMREIPKSEKASIILRLFKIVFGSVTLFKSNESALFPHLRTIIEACLKKATSTRFLNNYLLLLRALFRSISGGKYEHFYKEIFPLLPGILSALMRLQKYMCDCAMQEILLELCLTIPARLSSLLQYLPSLMKSVVKAIISRGELAYLGLRTLEFWVDNLNPDFLYPIMTSQDRLLTEIIEALNTHLLPPPYQYGELAMRILGKIGGRNRQYASDALNIDYSEISGYIKLPLVWEKCDEELNLNIGIVAQRVAKLMRELMKKSVHISAFSYRKSGGINVEPHDEGFLATPTSSEVSEERISEANWDTINSIRHSIQLYKSSATSFISRTTYVVMSRNVTASRLRTSGQEGLQRSSTIDEKLDEQALRCLIGTLFQASTDGEVGADGLKYLKAIYTFACKNVLEACSRSSATPSVLSEIRQSTLFPASRGLSPGRHLATLKRVDAIKEAMYGKVHIASCDSACNVVTLQRAIISALCSSDELIVQNGKLAIKWIVDTCVEHYSSSREAVQHAGAIFNQFCELCCHSCYDKSSWRNKLGGVYGILALIDLLDPCWTHENLLITIKALFFVLTDHPAEITAMISTYTGKAMLKAIEKSWEAKKSNYSDANGEKSEVDFQKCAAFQDTELFQMFVVELFSPKASSRRYAKECISKFAGLSNSTPSSLLFPYHQLIGKQIMGTNLRLLPVGTRTGYIDAMAYSLSLDPPIFSLNKDVLMFLQDVWGLISDDTSISSPPALSSHSVSGPSKVGDAGINGDIGSNVASTSSPVPAQEYPFGLSQVCEMRIAAVKLLRAAFLAGPDEINQHHEARNRFVGVFFRYLTGQPLELVLCAQEALTDVIHLNKHNKDISLPKELLQQCLRPVLLNLADYRKLNIPLLDGLSRLLSLLSSCFNVTLGEKLLEHLKQWRDPERIMKAGIWKRGEEPAVAASIIDLFHLLPPNDSFLEPLINCVVELEAVLPRYGSFGKMSSPYRIPLTKFLNRYASLTVGFFLKKEHVIDPNYSILFQELIKVPEAGPIRAVLTGDGGAEAIMAATFLAASKLGSYVGDLKSGDLSDDAKIQAQIQLNAQKAAAQAVAAAQAQGMSASSAEARGIQARAAFVAKAQAQINAQHAVKTQSQIQIQANAQKIHTQTLVSAQAQGLSLVQAQAKAQHASKEYITKAQSQITSGSMQVPLSSSSSSVLASQQQALHAQIQVNAQKVHAQALAAAQAQGLKPIQAQEKAKQAQATYVHRAKAQAQAKLARAQSQNAAGSVANSGQKFHQEALELHYQGLRLVRSISKIHPGWLGSQIGLIDCLKKLWRSSARIQRLLANDRLPIRYHMESKLMIKCFINYSRAKQDDVQILLDMLSVFLHKTSFDFSFLQCYYREEVAVSFSPTNKRNIIRLFLRMLHEPNASEELKVYAIQMLVVPILTTTFEDPNVDNSEVLDSETIMWMLKEILASKEYPLDSMQLLRIELLKLGTMLIQHMSKYVTDHRKEVIKFAWNHLKAPDLSAKLWGYVNVCRFISVYDTPPKIVLQVYVALLRTHEMDSRFLVRKAFDVLLPALPNRLPSNEFIKAIKWTKKIAYEEGHVLGQLVHIWFLIVRHPALFYPFRSQFVPLMVNSLNRLAIPPSSTPDNRRLAVNIVDLIVSWEDTRRKRIESRKMDEKGDEGKRLEDCNNGKRMMPSDHDKQSRDSILKKRKVDEESCVNVTMESKEVDHEDSLKAIKSDVRSPSCEDDFELNSVMVDLVVNFAFRFALASADKQETSRLSKTCGDLFNKALLLWPSASIRFSYFDKLIAVTAEVLVRQQNMKPNGVASSAASHAASIPPFFTVPKGAPLSSLAILDAVLGILNTLISSEVVDKSSRSIPYVIQYTPRIMKLLEPCFDRNNSEIQSSLSIFLKRMVELFPPSRVPQQLQSSKFYIWLKDIINDRLSNLLLVQNEGILAQQRKQKSRGPTQGTSSKNEVKQMDSGSVGDGPGTQEKGSKSEGNAMTQMDGSHRKLLLGQYHRGISSSCYILNLVVVISEAAPSFADNFTPLLLKLTQSFMKEHLMHTKTHNRFSPANTPSQKSAASGGEQSMNDIADKVMATPSIAILTEWTKIQSGHSVLSRNNFTVRTEENQMTGGSKDTLCTSVKDSSVTKTREQLLRSTGPTFKGKVNVMGCVGRRSTVEMLIACLKLISVCSLSVPEHRRMYLNLLMHCIESSRDIALLLEVIGIVEGMIMSDKAFSLKEKLSLVAKMTSFERMHEATALSVFGAYHRLLLKLSKTDEMELASLSPSSDGFPSQFMMGLMAPESATREAFLNRFLVDTDDHPTSRLQHVLKQDWQICGSRFWVVILVDVLLASVRNTSFVEQNEFIEEIKAADIFEPLRVLAQIDVHIAGDLWVSLFNKVWSMSTDASRKGISENLSVILSSKFHTRHLQVPFDMCHGRFNVVQSLLKAVTLVQPLPVMTPELIMHLAPTYSVWTDAIRLCEFQVQNDQIDAELRGRWIESLSGLYRQLNEDDLFVGLHVNHSSQIESRVALLLEALGCVHEAQEEYLKGLTRTNSSPADFEAISISELRLWEERWVECAKQLCQWQLMNDFAKATQSPELLLDCAWKRGDWNSAKQLLLSPSTQTSLETWCPESRLQRLYIAILDGEKKSTVETLSAQTVELALTQWQGLPRVLSRAHVPLMHLFHKFIEVKESIQMMSDIKCASQQHSLPNLKPSINTWRERLPNKWEPILLWDDILTWRSHMFQVVKSTFAWSDPQVLACMHDTPWSVIKLAHTARKQHLPDVCLGALSKLYSVPAMDVQDAFSKLREQVSICYESSTEYSGGLSILNNTNLDYFSLRQKSEMFRLKALFLQSMGRLSDANQTFSQCLQICDSYGKGWLSWGNYCYELFLSRRETSIASQAIACYLQAIHHRCNSGRMMIARVLWLLSMDDSQGTLIQSFEAHGKQLPIWIWIIWIPQLLMALNRPEAPQIRGLLRGIAAKFPQALYYTMRAFFLDNKESAIGSNSKQSRPPTPSGSVSSTLGNGPVYPGHSIPSTPNNGSSAEVSDVHTEYLYFRTKTGSVVGIPATSSAVRIQEIPGIIGPARTSPTQFGIPIGAVLSLEAWKEKVGIEQNITRDNTALYFTEDLLNFLRRSHDPLAFEMECMLEEIIVRFRPEPEEELLTAVQALLLKCYQLPLLNKSEPVPRMLQGTLAKVCKKFFVLMPFQKHEKHLRFVNEFKEKFELDFAVRSNLSTETDQKSSTPTLYEIVRRLQSWKNLLQARVQNAGDRSGNKLYLEHSSRHLIELSSTAMEVPGQYISDAEPIKDLHARIAYFENTSDVLLRNGYTQRRVTIGGSNGKRYSFLVQYAMTHITRTDERVMQMHLLLNRLLLRHKESRRRNAVYHVQKVVPLTPRVRLLEDSTDFVTLGEIYELHFQRAMKDPDLPIEHYREKMYIHHGSNVIESSTNEDEMKKVKFEIFDEICSSMVPESLLSKYVYGLSRHSDDFFRLRSEFTVHLALTSFLTYILHVADRIPHRILFSRKSGRVLSAELRPSYTNYGLMDASSEMPFRMTRNLMNFITRVGLNGPFRIILIAASEALMSEGDVLNNQLSLFFRDDLLSWHDIKYKSRPDSDVRQSDEEILQLVEKNVQMVVQRVKILSLKKISDHSCASPIDELLNIATSPEQQSTMPPTWYPWL